MKLNVKVGDEVHKIERLTLGDLLDLKKHFGIDELRGVAQRLENGDPALLAGLTYIALRATHPTWEHARLMNEVQDIDSDFLEIRDPPDEDADPKEAPAVEPADTP